MLIARYRVLRQSCRITVGELAREIGISHQRLSQIELKTQGYKVEDPERLIVALEGVVMRQMDICRYTLDHCQRMRGKLFDMVTAAEARP